MSLKLGHPRSQTCPAFPGHNPWRAFPPSPPWSPAASCNPPVPAVHPSNVENTLFRRAASIRYCNGMFGHFSTCDGTVRLLAFSCSRILLRILRMLLRSMEPARLSLAREHIVFVKERILVRLLRRSMESTMGLGASLPSSRRIATQAVPVCIHGAL